MENIFQKAFNVACAMIGYNQGVTDDDINNALNFVMHSFPKVDRDALKAELLESYTVKVESVQILDGKESRKPWLKEFRAEKKSEWPFWKRYIQYLASDKGFPQASIHQIDDLTEKVLDRLFNPRIPNIQINKKGLVVGQVQSGKTANYTGLICKAADAGFNLIIVLAGIHNNLRSQTQTRLDEGFLGFDTQFSRRVDAGETTKIGAGLVPGFNGAIANSITTSAERGDFTRNAADTFGINFETPSPILMVIKKNVSVMKRVITWFRAVSPDAPINSKAVLLVDDEADNASINTNRKDEDPTQVNYCIRTILSKFNRAAYVGYTATPFANIFIPLGPEDLFPKDFIINIPAPDNYIGPEKVFGTSIVPDDTNDDLLPIVNTIEDYSDFIPSGHKNTDPLPSFGSIPDSLKTAIKCFIITCAVRIARGQGSKHNSMLIHITRYQVWQNHIKELVEQLFKYYKAEIEANDETMLEEFRQIFEQDHLGYKSYTTVTSEIMNSSFKNLDSRIRIHSWKEIKPLLYKAVQKIEVKSINGSSGDALTYYENEENGISVIAIGGDKLSRGLTLEGLSVSYFLRASKMYDTLMQMGRWFGYRPGYVDLCRIFLSPELNDWFRHITIASEELREEFNYLTEAGATPDSYSLKVRTHPGCLQITSLSKRRYTRDIQVSWSGRLVETYQLPLDAQTRARNLEYTDNFISGLDKPTRPKGHEECFLWTNISPDNVCNYFGRFRVGENLVKVNLDLICQYIRNLNNSNELDQWNVALVSRKTKANDAGHRFTNGLEVNSFLRNKADGTTKESYCIRKNHIVGDQKAEFIDIDENVLGKALEVTRNRKTEQNKEWTKDYPAPEIVRNEFRDKHKPLLMIYPLDAYGAAPDNLKHTDDPIIGLVIAFPKTERDDMAIGYTANQIAEYAETEKEFDNNNDNTYDNE